MHDQNRTPATPTSGRAEVRASIVDEMPQSRTTLEPPAVAFSLRDVTISYDGRSPALSNVTLDLEFGDAVALIGPNGSGKSTLLKAMLGLNTVTSGQIEVLGTTPRRASSRVGYMPQSDEIDSNFPVSLRQVVLMGLYREIGLFRWPRREHRERVAAAIDRVGLTEHADKRFGSLSGGQQQRGMLARAIVANPKLILLDEPFNGLDQRNRRKLLAMLRELREEGVAIVVSTHDFEIATESCSHALLLNRRQIVFGTLAEALTTEHMDAAFGAVTADDEAHGHFHLAHGHYHDTGFMGITDQHGTVEAHMDSQADER